MNKLSRRIVKPSPRCARLDCVGAAQDPDVRELVERLCEVDPLDPAELRELNPSLVILEALAIRDSPPFAAARIAGLRAANRRLLDATGDGAAAALADDEFHRLLTADCGNPRLLEVVDAVRRSMLAYERVYMLSPERVARSVEEHEAIVAALERGDHARATDLVRANYATGMPELEAQLRERGDG